MRLLQRPIRRSVVPTIEVDEPQLVLRATAPALLRRLPDDGPEQGRGLPVLLVGGVGHPAVEHLPHTLKGRQRLQCPAGLGRLRVVANELHPGLPCTCGIPSRLEGLRKPGERLDLLLALPQQPSVQTRRIPRSFLGQPEVRRPQQRQVLELACPVRVHDLRESVHGGIEVALGFDTLRLPVDQVVLDRVERSLKRFEAGQGLIGSAQGLLAEGPLQKYPIHLPGIQPARVHPGQEIQGLSVLCLGDQSLRLEKGIDVFAYGQRPGHDQKCAHSQRGENRHRPQAQASACLCLRSTSGIWGVNSHRTSFHFQITRVLPPTVPMANLGTYVEKCQDPKGIWGPGLRIRFPRGPLSLSVVTAPSVPYTSPPEETILSQRSQRTRRKNHRFSSPLCVLGDLGESCSSVPVRNVYAQTIWSQPARAGR